MYISVCVCAWKRRRLRRQTVNLIAILSEQDDAA